MKFDFGFFKRNPIVTGAFVVFAVVLFFILSGWGRGSSGGTTVVAQGPSEAQINASTQLQVAGMQTQAMTYAAQLELESERENLEASKYLAELGAQIETARLGTQERLGMASLDATMETSQLQLEALKVQTDAALQGLREQNSAALSVRQMEINLQDTLAARAQYDYQTTVRLANDLAMTAQQNNASLLQQLLNKQAA